MVVVKLAERANAMFANESVIAEIKLIAISNLILLIFFASFRWLGCLTPAPLGTEA